MTRRLTFGWRRVTDGAVRLPIVMTFVVAMFAATMGLVWFGYVATREWRDGTNLLLERRANEALALVRVALSGDMKGAWLTAIVPFNTTTLEEDPPFGTVQVAARTFARFPYPESFVVWRQDGRSDGTTYVFNRADRQPPWETQPSSDDPFPVVLVRDPAPLAGLVKSVRKHASASSPFIMLEKDIDGTPYQIVAHALFDSGPSHALLGFMAFTVNEQWLQTQYFDPLVEQVAKIGGGRGGLSITVSDEQGRPITKAAPLAADATGELQTRFPLLFIDPALVKSISNRPTHVREWTVHVRSVPDQALLATLQGARRMFYLISIAAGASLLALVLTVRADRASAALASMKSDFVAAVTHELKTPVASIRLVGDTLSNGRYNSPKTVQEYASLLSVEASRLGASIDNLLTYARYSSSPAASSMADVEPADLVEDALQGLRLVLTNREFDVEVDVPSNLPQVCVDRPAMIQALDNIVDNAIKYSTTEKHVAVKARANGKTVTLTVRDKGPGIARKDLSRVFERFYRGGNVTVSGSGLGLPIAKRIVESHGGSIEVRSAEGSGTEVDVTLPIGRRQTA
jgi:two-component system phosphate regulon sensor histidine kinase PhoR